MGDGYTGADCFVDALERYGVEYVFGNPGTTELPVSNALADGDLEYVLGLHEDIAVGMAGGYASTRRSHRARRTGPRLIGRRSARTRRGLLASRSGGGVELELHRAVRPRSYVAQLPG